MGNRNNTSYSLIEDKIDQIIPDKQGSNTIKFLVSLRIVIIAIQDGKKLNIMIWSSY